MTAATEHMASHDARPAEAASTRGRTAVRAWLFVVCGLIGAMILVGGATRITDSGLSITEWQPIMGAIPPLNHADWMAAFQKYQQIPQAKIVNPGMTLGAFKSIFWWEWGHRFLGRFIGVAFALPFLIFCLTGTIRRTEYLKFGAMFVAGGLQGALGWYMVESGLVDRVDVSQYRLAAHLGLAVAIAGFIFWVALTLERFQEKWKPVFRPETRQIKELQRFQEKWKPVFRPETRQINRLESGFDSIKTEKALDGPRGRERDTAPGAGIASGGLLLGLIYLQMLLGAFVAGLDAGQGYNTWPLMDGAVVPAGLFAADPWYRNLFENAMTVQFDHRMLAYVVGLWACIHTACVWRSATTRPQRLSAAAVLAMVALQIGLGIWTLLERAPIGLGLAHQAGAVTLFALAIVHLAALTGRLKLVRLSRDPGVDTGYPHR